jgi:Ni/Co efflux regulator RcnB
MNKLFVCAVALGLLASAPVLAQPNDHNGDKRDGAASHGDRGAPSTGPRQNGQGSATKVQNGRGRAMTGDTHANPARTPNAGPAQQAPAANTSEKHVFPNSGDVRPNTRGRSTTDKARNNSGWSGNPTNHQPAGNARQGNPGWSGNTARPEISAMRRNMQSSRHFRSGSYNAPRGYQQRHWGFGERLPPSYFLRNYWITNFLMFDLFAPPSYLVWVRVGDDALLIDRETGEIVQVRYGVFY